MSCSKDIEKEISIFLNNEDSQKDIDVLCDLAEEQWHMYEPLKKNVKRQIEDYIKSIIDFESYEIIESIIFIMGHLGLDSTFDLLCMNKDNIQNQAVRVLIEETIDELKDSIKDPYLSLRQK